MIQYHLRLFSTYNIHVRHLSLTPHSREAALHATIFLWPTVSLFSSLLLLKDSLIRHCCAPLLALLHAAHTNFYPQYHPALDTVAHLFALPHVDTLPTAPFLRHCLRWRLLASSSGTSSTLLVPPWIQLAASGC
jgi:hypothetical protein